MHNKNSEKILDVRLVNKTFTNIEAVKDISFTIKRGDIFAFIGPNGAGKTTTLRMLLDIIKPDHGAICWHINGSPGKQPMPEHIGYLPEERGLYLDIPILKSLIYLAQIRGMNKQKARNAAMEWLEKFGLEDRAKEKLQHLSKGNQQKIQFAAAILHKPDFAILDEPFSGLDPLNQDLFIDYIKEINEQGTTILLSAHQMQLVEKIAEKIFLIHNGQKLYSGPLSDLFETFGKQHMIRSKFNFKISENSIKQFTEVENINRIDDFQFELILNKGADLNKTLSELSSIGGLADMTSRRPDLHDIFVKLVKESA